MQRAAAIAVRLVAQHHVGGQVGAAAQGRDHAVGMALDDLELALRAPGVLQRDQIADLQRREPVGVDAQHRIGLGADRAGRAGRTQRQPRRCDHPAQLVAARAQPHHLRAALDRAGAQLRAAQVHQDPHLAAGAARGQPHRLGHRLPLRRRVVGAVDARDVHAGLHHRVDPARIGGGLARQRHHDAHVAPGRRAAQQRHRMPLQRLGAGAAADRLVRVARRPVAAVQPVQQTEHLVDRGQHMRLGAAQGGQPEPGKLELQRSQVTGAQRQVVQQVARARLVGRVDGRQPVGMAVGQRGHLAPQRPQPLDQRLADRRIPAGIDRGRDRGRREVWRRHDVPLASNAPSLRGGDVSGMTGGALSP